MHPRARARAHTHTSTHTSTIQKAAAHVAHREQSTVEEHEDAEDGEEDAASAQANADFAVIVYHIHGCADGDGGGVPAAEWRVLFATLVLPSK